MEQPSRDLADVPALEVVSAAALHLMSAAAVNLGLAEDLPDRVDLDEARTLIEALAGLVTASAPRLGHHHAAPLRDGLRTLQLAFREASTFPDPPGDGPGETLTGPVHPPPTRPGQPSRESWSAEPGIMVRRTGNAGPPSRQCWSAEPGTTVGRVGDLGLPRRLRGICRWSGYSARTQAARPPTSASR